MAGRTKAWAVRRLLISAALLAECAAGLASLSNHIESRDAFRMGYGSSLASSSPFGFPVDRRPARDRIAHPTCYVHIGTHKTGTTALQQFLRDNAGALRTAGVLIPQAGRPAGSDGHHNIAWQLSGDRRFSADDGTLADLIEEVRTVGAPAVCISSEDFEYLGAEPAALQQLRFAFERIGYNVAAVIYLRPQAEYAESLYAELLNHGYARSFEAYLESLLTDGAVAFGRWRFVFDYDLLVGTFAAIFGPERLIVRPYLSRRIFGSLSDDLLRTLCGANTSRLLLKHRERRLNAGPSFAAVVRRYRQNLQAAGYGGKLVLQNLPAGRRRFDPLRLADVERIARRFAAGNQRIFRRYGVSIACITRHQLLADVIAALGFGRGARNLSDLFAVEPGEGALDRRAAVTTG